MELPFLVKTCDLFVYLNLHFCSFQFEEVISTFVANIHQSVGVDWRWLPFLVCDHHYHQFSKGNPQTSQKADNPLNKA